MPRFVVLEHDSPRGLHWDFMLESGSVLATWALPAPPDRQPRTTAEALPDHRLDYLEYEGAVSGDRGSVARWDVGEYRVEKQSDSEWLVELTGRKLAGRVVLRRLVDTPARWEFSYKAGSRE